MSPASDAAAAANPDQGPAAQGIVLDHLVVAATSLAEGVVWCERTLGVTPGPGGRHAMFGTHNRLLSLSSPDQPLAYLEIIAVDPAAPPPSRPRWFGLDALAAGAPPALTPRLVHWVARSAALGPHANALRALGLDPGPPVAASRDTPHGLLRWSLLVRDDGALLQHGVLPTLIAWEGRHPCADLPKQGVTLTELTLQGLDPGVVRALQPQGVSCVAGPPALRARLRTPRGEVTLSSA